MSVWGVSSDSHPPKTANHKGQFTSKLWRTVNRFLPPISPSTGGLPLAAFNLGKVRPYQRGFFCSDDSIRYPFHNSTVTSTVLYSVGLTLPISCVSRRRHRRQRATHCRHHVDLSTTAAITAVRCQRGLDDVWCMMGSCWQQHTVYQLLFLPPTHPQQPPASPVVTSQDVLGRVLSELDLQRVDPESPCSIAVGRSQLAAVWTRWAQGVNSVSLASYIYTGWHSVFVLPYTSFTGTKRCPL